MQIKDFFKTFFKEKEEGQCSFLSSLVFDYNNNVFLCPYSKDFIFENDFNGIWLDIDKLLQKRNEYLSNLELQNQCKTCKFKKVENNTFSTFEYLYLANWKYCYLNCSYCNAPKEEDLVKAKHFDVYNSICQLADRGLISKNTKIIFEAGDATVHPEFDKIMYYFINSGFTNIVVNTPAMRFCESICEAIAKNICEVVISFDSGCPFIYEKVKGQNKFDVAIANIKRYLSFQLPSEKRVALKYTLINGVNDNQKELLDCFMLSRDLGVKKLAIDIDDKWFEQIKYSVPQYLKELLLFINRMSDYNNFEIELSPKIAIIYGDIKEN
ncbi:MAG: radical SAM protein [Candidatus Gastranaerophilales bacterium]|nr:radical SAM protein [Candidatus Gastranaerophilales bacterium]